MLIFNLFFLSSQKNMIHLLKRFLLLFALLIGAWLFVYAMFSFATFSPETEHTLQQYSLVTALVVFIIIVVYQRIKIGRILP